MELQQLPVSMFEAHSSQLLTLTDIIKLSMTCRSVRDWVMPVLRKWQADGLEVLRARVEKQWYVVRDAYQKCDEFITININYPPCAPHLRVQIVSAECFSGAEKTRLLVEDCTRNTTKLYQPHERWIEIVNQASPDKIVSLREQEPYVKTPTVTFVLPRRDLDTAQRVRNVKLPKEYGAHVLYR